MTHELRFFVPGIPVPQGSHSVSRSGHLYDVNKALPKWRKHVSKVAEEAMLEQECEQFTQAVHVSAIFAFPRPKSHYRTGKHAELLKAGAPLRHIVKPDLDKLTRSVGDALTTSGVLKDDCIIADLRATKRYTQMSNVVGMYVYVTELI